MCGIFIDLQKAFDTVNHEILLLKLEYYGFRGIVNDWFKSYLSDRKQYVSVNGFNSSDQTITCGVPQGSTLGPLLFLIYLNDLCSVFQKSLIHHFADDTNLLYYSKKLSTIQSVMNYELKLLVSWLRCNKLSLNETKTELIVFRPYSKIIPNNFVIKINNFKLTPCKYVKYLGVLIDEFLTWEFHFESISQKIAQSIGIISKLRHYVPRKSCISVYYAIVYSYLTYGCLTWQFTNENYIKKLNILHKKCIRVITFSSPFEHTTPLFKSLNLLNLQDIFVYFVLVFFHKLSLNLVPPILKSFFTYVSTSHNHDTRSINILSLPFIKSSRFGVKSMRFSGAKIWNQFLKSVCDRKCISSLFKLKSFYKKSCIDKYD